MGLNGHVRIANWPAFLSIVLLANCFGIGEFCVIGELLCYWRIVVLLANCCVNGELLYCCQTIVLLANCETSL